MTTGNFGKVAATPTDREMHFGGTQQLQLSNGNIVHVWLDDASTEGERTIWARVFKPDGTEYPSPQGDEFQVNEWDGGPGNSTSEKKFTNISLAEAADGGFADGGFNVFWQSYAQSNDPDESTDPNQGIWDKTTDLMVRSYSASGTPDPGGEKNLETFMPRGGLAEYSGLGTQTNSLLLSNGHTIVSWVEPDEMTNQPEWNSMILDENMNVVHDETGLISTSVGYYDGHGGWGPSYPGDTTTAPHKFDTMSDTHQIEMADGNVLFFARGYVRTNSAQDNAEYETFAWIVDPETNTLVKDTFQISTPADGPGYTSAGMDFDPTTNTYALFSVDGQTGRLYRQDIDQNGDPVGTPQDLGLLDTPNLPAGQTLKTPSVAVTVDAAGNTVAFYATGRATSGHPGTVYAKVFPKDGAALPATLEFQSNGMASAAEGQLMQLADGTFYYGFSAGNGGVGHHNRWGGTFSLTGTTAPCFVRGTAITTLKGQVNVEDLKAGDLVLTMDRGFQPVRWIGSKTVSATGNMAPIEIAEGTLNTRKTLRVSPQHRMYLNDAKTGLLFGTSEVLVPAKSLVNGRDIQRVEGGTVEYFHILFDTHEIIFANGSPTESFHPGEVGLSCLDSDARKELYSIFPEFLEGDFAAYGASVRPSLKPSEAQALHG